MTDKITQDEVRDALAELNLAGRSWYKGEQYAPSSSSVGVWRRALEQQQKPDYTTTFSPIHSLTVCVEPELADTEVQVALVEIDACLQNAVDSQDRDSVKHMVSIKTLKAIRALQLLQQLVAKGTTPCEDCNPMNNPLCTTECQEVCPECKNYKPRIDAEMQAFINDVAYIMEFHAGRCPLAPERNFSGSEEHLAMYRRVMKQAKAMRQRGDPK